ncbi:MAG: S53 family peptidase [Mycobacteriales bacterium]
MPTVRRLSRGAVLAGAVALLAGLLAAAPASASGPQSTITVLLKAPNPQRLAQLALTTGENHKQRVADLASALPSAATHQAVRSVLLTDGFTIGHQTAWTIQASGPTSVVQTLFGSFSALGRSRARGVLPAIPANLSGLASAVLTDQGATPIFRTHASLAGPDFRNAYSAPRQSPTEGADRNGPLTIATLQFANWNDVDLSDYAAQPSVNIKPDPVSSGQYKQFGVDGSKLSPATEGLDEEVDLDQESLLSTAPNAKQRAYFDTNSSDGYVQALSQVLADVTQGQGKSSDGGDPHIAALSTSWGACEDDFSTSFRGDTMKTVEPLLQSLNAAGVTIFAASGDDGVYDCGHGTSNKIAVDYPASSPSVVAVGGTRLTSPGGSAANDGTNWSDTAWSCKDTTACESAKGTGGSGGGESKNFPIPAYQASGIGHQAFRTGTGHRGDFGAEPNRLVPDIAVDGAPSTGFKILTTDKDATCPNPLNIFCDPTSNPTTLVVGGTSLSSPLAAALFTNLLATHGATSGVGDIHAALYSAYAAKNGVFRDVTSGRNGNQADVDSHAASKSAAELPTKAQVGFDTVSGLGAPLWPLLAPYVFSPKPPTAHASMVLATPHARGAHNQVKVSWHPGPAGNSRLLAGDASVVVTRVGDATPVYHRAHAPASGSDTFTGVAGGNYVVTVTERDIAGHNSAPDSAEVVVPFDDTAFRLQGAWSTVSSGHDFGGSHVQTSTTHAAAKVTASGRQYLLLARVGPTFGKIAVFRGKTRVKTIDLFKAGAGHKAIAFYGSPRAARKVRTFSFVCIGKHGAFTNKTTVNIDGLEVID